jgi:hypothetical protein
MKYLILPLTAVLLAVIIAGDLANDLYWRLHRFVNASGEDES